MTKKEIDIAVKQALKTGNWMLRKSDNGKSHKGFQWNDIGKWTEAPDWNEEVECGGGLHGNHYSLKESGYWSDYKDLDFCETDGKHVVIDDSKIKCKRARVLLRNELPEIKLWNGDLCLDNNIFSEEIVLPTKFNGALFLNSCMFSERIILPLEINGYLTISDCTFLKRTIFPQEINGSLYLYKAIFRETISLPSEITGDLKFNKCVFPKNATFSLDIINYNSQ